MTGWGVTPSCLCEGSPLLKKEDKVDLHPKLIFDVLGLVGKGFFALPNILRPFALLRMTGWGVLRSIEEVLLHPKKIK